MGTAVDTTTTRRFWTFRRKLWAIGAALSMAAFAAAGHWLPDLGLRYGLIRSLRELGWAQVSVSDADLSLFNGAIVVHRVEAGEELGKMLGIAGIDLKFRWTPLFSRRVSVEHLDLKGVAIDIRREGTNYVVNGLPVAVAGTSGAPTGAAWTYDITALTLADSRINFTDGAVKAVIQVDTLELADLKSWEPSVPVRYRLTGSINGAPMSLDGTATPFADAPQFALKLTLDALDLASVAELARQSGAGTPIGKISADLALEGSHDTVQAAGKLSLKNGAWESGTTKLSAASLELNLSRTIWNGDRLELAGTAAAQAMTLEDGGLTLQADTVALNARSAAYEAKAAILSWDGQLHTERHSLAVDDIRINHGRLDWTGTTRLNLAAAATSFVHAEGKAEATDVRIAIGALAMEASRITTEGMYEHARPDGHLPPLAGRMSGTAEQVWVREPGQDWLHADRIDATDLRLTPGSMATLARLEARNLAALAKRSTIETYPWRLEARQTVVERASLAADGAAAASSLTLTGAKARITRTKGGFLGLPQSEGGEATKAPALALGKLRVSDSQVNFEDRSPSQRVRLRLEGIDATIAEMDSAKPDHDSPFTAKARIGTALLSLNGHGRPFAASPSAELKGEIRALELPPLSPYAADSLGVHLQTGQLDADISMGATQGKLNGAMQLTLSELFVAQPDPNAPLAKRADMPVETVLDLLRDSDNRIKLSIPVRGDLSNPDFDVSDAVGQAVGGALRSTVFTTLKVAFPLAGLISLVIDDSESRRLALEPLSFLPGADALGEAERKRLSAVADLMVEHPPLKLTLCGAAQPDDWDALVERKREEKLGILAKLQKLVGTTTKTDLANMDMNRLSDLANSRAQTAKGFLVDQAGIDPGRLFTCRPRVETDGKSLPRVDLLL